MPPEQDAAFVCQREEVLDIYKKPYDPQCPHVCMDEMSTQLMGEVRAPLPSAPGKPLRRFLKMNIPLVLLPPWRGKVGMGGTG